VLRSESKAPRKRGRDATTPGKTTIRASKCKRVVTIDCAGGATVELKRNAVAETARVLLGELPGDEDAEETKDLTVDCSLPQLRIGSVRRRASSRLETR